MLKRFIGEAECVPKGYGVAYREMHRFGAICYPMPINLIVAVWHHFITWLTVCCFHWKTGEDKHCQICFEAGKRSAVNLYENKIEALETMMSRLEFYDPKRPIA